MARVKVSKEMVEYLLKKYENLNENKIKYIFKYASLKLDELENDIYGNNKNHFINVRYFIHIEKNIADLFNIDNELPAIGDENGVIFQIIEN